jgi:hypothetical protein
MSYMLLIVEPTGQRLGRSTDEGQQAYASMLRYAEALKARGVLQASESLESSDTRSARVQVRGGQRRVVDGPYAEAKEMVGGFFLLDCASREEAIAIAAECPAAEWASIEVRKVGPCWA